MSNLLYLLWFFFSLWIIGGIEQNSFPERLGFFIIVGVLILAYFMNKFISYFFEDN